MCEDVHQVLAVGAYCVLALCVVQGPDQGQIMYPLSFVMGYMRGKCKMFRLLFVAEFHLPRKSFFVICDNVFYFIFKNVDNNSTNFAFDIHTLSKYCKPSWLKNTHTQTGSSNPNLRLIFLQIMPRGQESEMLGFYFFCSMGFSWGPPLLFTAINEAGFRTNYGLATMSVLPIIGFGTLHMMGQIESAVEDTRRKGKETIPTVSEAKG